MYTVLFDPSSYGTGDIDVRAYDVVDLTGMLTINAATASPVSTDTTVRS